MELSDILFHEGENRSEYQNAVSPPISQTSNFIFNSVDDMLDGVKSEFNNEKYAYTRGNNPTVQILRDKFSAMEGSEDSLVLSSGVAAISSAILSNVKAGDHIICEQKPYGWTSKLLKDVLKKFNVDYTLVDASDINAIEEAIQPNTKILMLESPNSMTLELQDIKACASLAKKHGILTILDNSYCTSLYQQPIKMGIDIVVYSASKYFNGHSDVVCGVVCSTTEIIRNIFYSYYMILGPVLSPNDAWLVLRGLRTLPLRLERSGNSTLKIIEYLEQHPKVKSVIYPMADSFPQKELARKQMKGAGGLFGVIYKSDNVEKMDAFCNALSKTFLLAVSWGGYESLQAPGSVSSKIDKEYEKRISFSFVRYYVGLEDPDFLIKRLDKALELL